MTTSKLDKNGDWAFGVGFSNYIKGSDEVKQNLVTRIKSFKFDNFLDISSEIDWMNILANKNNKQTVLREVERVALATSGLRTIEEITIDLNREKREATLIIDYTDVFSERFQEEIGISI